MPVDLLLQGQFFRCLELVFSCSSPLRVLLGLRTDPDRHGESADVVAWPPLCDPRARTVCRRLVLGLAAMVVQYASPSTAVQFLN